MQPRPPQDSSSLPFPVLVADIGGTNARFAIIADAEGEITHFPAIRTADFPDPQTAIRAAVLPSAAVMPRSLAIAIAGPVGKAGGRLTNGRWGFTPAGLLEALALEEVLLLNDFEALALALPAIGRADLLKIGGGEPHPTGPRVVIGPGTGLGVAALVDAGRQLVPIAGEGGHVSFGPDTEEDLRIWPHLTRLHGRITGEALLSGPGLARIYGAVTASRGTESRLTTGEEVSAAALSGDPDATVAVECFATYLGRLAGDFALLFLARGGVFIGGGIAPRLIDQLASGAFRRAFDEKAPHAAIMREIPVFIILDERAALTGLAALARMPDRYCIAPEARLPRG